ncbi:MAG: PAS domain S-box protein [Clostridiaceae bacterium]|nr:PAS domain S-box protein [Clostridiaceae bacterium]
MKKRIYKNMLTLTTLAILLVSVLFCFVFYNQFTTQVKADLREQSKLFANDDTESALGELNDYRPSDIRATLILGDGTVLFDNVSDAGALENHLERTEVQEAIVSGFGESSRYSNTLGLETYYYAVRLTDGGILRFAKTTQSIWGLFAGALPIILGIIAVIIIISYIAASRLTKRIVEPINNVDLSGELTAPYDELAPFIRTIANQRRKISEDFAALQDSRDTIHTITENMNEGIVMVDAGGVVLTINKSARAIFGTDAYIEGRNIRELSRDISLTHSIGQALLGYSENTSFEKDGRIFNVLISPVSKTGAILFFLDITEKALADERRREFSANVSHELKTPLTSIYGNAELLCGGMVNEDDKPNFYQKIMDEASRLIALIEDIIMISELDERAEQQTFELVNLADVALDCKEALAEKASVFSVDVEIDGTGYITGSYSLIYEMLFNLMDNAIKYNKPGGSATVAITEDTSQITLIVSDTGIGIPPGERERIFERFYRVDKSRSKKTGGTGLGLAIVKHIASLVGGTVSVASEQGKGSTFTVYFNKMQQKQ